MGAGADAWVKDEHDNPQSGSSVWYTFFRSKCSVKIRTAPIEPGPFEITLK
jgi:hypothetical protein